VALEILVKARALGRTYQELAGREPAHDALMGIYADLTTGGVSTGVAADLVGVPRETATRKPPIPVRGSGRTGEQARLR
jgi:hypothetical protein